MCEWLGYENLTEKVKSMFLIFSVRFLSHIEGPVIIEKERGWFGDKNRAEKVKPMFLIFSAQFS